MKSIIATILLFASSHLLLSNTCSTAYPANLSSNWQTLSDDQFDGQESWYVFTAPSNGIIEVCWGAGYTIYGLCLNGNPTTPLSGTPSGSTCQVGLATIDIQEYPISYENTIYILVQAGFAGSAIDVRFIPNGGGSCVCYEQSFNYPPIGSIAQCESFEGYQNGGLTPQSSLWSKWDSGARDGEVRDYSQGKYLRMLYNADPAQDVLYNLGNRQSGRYRLSWRMHVFDGYSGYYNIQHTNQGDANSNWAYSVYFNANGQGLMTLGSQPGTVVATFTFRTEEWTDVMQIIDLYSDEAELWINGTFVYSWTFSQGSQPLNQLGAINFYAGANTNDGSAMGYGVDQICLWRVSCDQYTVNTNLGPVCVNGVDYASEYDAQCQGYTDHEWTPGYCEPVVTNCYAAVPIQCGQAFYNQTTTGQENNFNNTHYGNCVSSANTFNAPDRIYKIDITQRQQVKILLDLTSGTDLDLFLLDECIDDQQVSVASTTNCIAASTVDNNAYGIYKEAIDIVLNSGTYYILVDGKSDNYQGLFNLIISCDCNCSEPTYDQPIGRIALCDDLEDYDRTGIAPQSTRWRFWDSQSADAPVVSYNDNQVLQLKDDGSTPSDVIYMLNGLTGGRYRISWRLFVESGRSAYYNIQHPVPGVSTPANWAYQVYFNEDGSGTLDLVNDDITFPYFNGGWNNIMQIIDINQDVAELWVNSNFIASWNFSEGTQGASLSLGAIDFYANTNNSYLIDQLCVWETDGFVDCLLSDPEVCGKNGRQYLCESHARAELYTSSEWGRCFSVCDYGGTNIFRGVEFSGGLGYSNTAPSELLSEPCVLNAFNGVAPNPLFADIFVFYNDQDQEIIMNLASSSNTAKAFLFRCSCDGPDCGQQCLGNFDDLNNNPISAAGVYYIVILNSVTDTYTFSISPGGYCQPNPTSLDCGAPINGTVSGKDNDFSTDMTDAYGNCYGGMRPYTGEDVEYQFALSEPSKVSLTLESNAPMGLFIYDFLCGNTCIDYAEIPTGGNTAIVDFDSLTLPEGIYYAVVDKSTDAGPSDFTLALNCERDVKAIYTTIQSDIGPPDDCPVDSNAFHSVGIRHSAYNFSPNDQVVFYTDDGAGGELVVSSQSYTATGPSINSDLYEDPYNDGLKCSYYEDEIISVMVVDAINNSNNYVRVVPEYAPFGVFGANADSTFSTGDHSVITDFTVVDRYDFSIPTAKEIFSAAGGLRTIVLTASNQFNWSIREAPQVNWLSLSANSGTGTTPIILTVNAYNNPLPRSTTLEFRFHASDIVLHLYLVVEQSGACIIPSASISASDTQPCAGEDVTLTANYNPLLEEIYSFQWSTGATTPSITVTPGAGDNYTLTVTEKNCGLQQILNSGLNVQPLPGAPANPQHQTICEGDAIPPLRVNVMPGQTIRWYNNPGAIGTPLHTGPSFTPPQAGTYYAQAEDGSSGCVSPTTTAVTLTVQSRPTASAGADKAICAGGSATLSASASGGAGSYTYEWSDGTTGALLSVSPASDASYTVVVTDANGCTASDEALVEVHPLPTPTLSVVSHALCSEAIGEITAGAQGGAAPYQYSWSNNASGPTVSGLPPGLYEVEVTDANGCSNTDNIIIEDIEGPVADAGPDVSICQGETTTLTASATGGDSSYEFEWQGGASSQASFAVSPDESTTYSIRVTDGNGCVGTDMVYVDVLENPSIATEPEVKICKGESIVLTASASGGQGPNYIYNWNNGAGSQASFTASPSEDTAYPLVVTDDSGCTASTTVTVYVMENPAVTIDATDATCGEADGAATAMGQGGAGGYDYLWSTGSTDNTISGLTPGVYLVTVTDAEGCSGESSAQISNLAGPEVTTSADQDICSGQSTEVSVTVLDGTGTPPFSYLWSNDEASSSQEVSPMATTEYTVTVTDINGCSAVGLAAVHVRPLPSADAGPDQAICPGEEATLTAASGDGYTYHWSTGETTQSIMVQPNVSSLYMLTVNRAGCEASDTVEVEVYPSIDPGLEIQEALMCHGDTDGSVSAAPSGGVPGYSYSWADGSTSSMISGLGSGSHIVTITDQAGCQVVASIQLTEPDPIVLPTVEIVPDTNNQQAGAIFITVSGGIPPYTFAWTGPGGFASSEQNPSGLGEGNYQVQITDANQCMVTSGLFNLIVPVSKEELPGTVRLFPNPTGGSFFLSFDLPNPEAVEARVMDVLGASILRESHARIQQETIELDLSEYPAGLYLARISIGNRTIVKRVILQKQ